MSEPDPYPTPTTPEGQTFLISVLARDIRTLTGAVGEWTKTMATKPELDALRVDLHAKIDALSTEVRSRDKAMSAEVDRKSIGSSLDRFLSLATRILAFCVVLVTFGGLVVGVVKFFDRLPAAAERVNQ